jgi:glutamate-1-semialdehyde 2,1-aminomutase
MSIDRGPRTVMKLALAIIESARLLLWTGIYGARYLASTSRRRGMDQRLCPLAAELPLRMGPLYVKAGQILGTQTGVMAQDAPRSSGRSSRACADAQPD